MFWFLPIQLQCPVKIEFCETVFLVERLLKLKGNIWQFHETVSQEMEYFLPFKV